VSNKISFVACQTKPKKFMNFLLFIFFIGSLPHPSLQTPACIEAVLKAKHLRQCLQAVAYLLFSQNTE